MYDPVYDKFSRQMFAKSPASHFLKVHSIALSMTLSDDSGLVFHDLGLLVTLDLINPSGPDHALFRRYDSSFSFIAENHFLLHNFLKVDRLLNRARCDGCDSCRTSILVSRAS